jgi:diadenosine tetraphosphate (Ap4A) HIT family hydrolase
MYRTRKSKKAYNPDAKRILYKSNPAACPFCDIAAVEIVEKGKLASVVRNIFPYEYWEFMDVTAHLLVIPKRHVSSLGHLTKDEKLEIMDLLAKYEAQGYNLYARTADSNMKTIPHQHTHLIKTKDKKAKAALYSQKPYFVWKI